MATLTVGPRPWEASSSINDRSPGPNFFGGEHAEAKVLVQRLVPRHMTEGRQRHGWEGAIARPSRACSTSMRPIPLPCWAVATLTCSMCAALSTMSTNT